MNNGVRPNKLWHWAIIALLTATFLSEPRAFVGLSWNLFQGAGDVGGQLITDTEQTNTAGNNDSSDEDGSREPSEGDTFAPPIDANHPTRDAVGGVNLTP